MINLFISESYGIFSDPQSTRIRISCIIRARQAILNRVGIATEPSFSFTPERRVPIDDFVVTAGFRSYDIAPDGERFVMVFPAAESQSGESARAEIIIVPNWFEELKRLLPTDN